MSAMFELFLEKPADLKLREITGILEPNDNEVRIKVIYGGICGSDLRVFKGSLPYATYPCRPGHEILGTVIEAGKKSRHKIGDRVASFPNTFCGECEYCLLGRTNICINKKAYGVTAEGLFGQEIILDSKYAIPVPDDLSDERAILVEPLAVNVHALKKARITKGTKMAVIGCGTEGLLSIAVASHLGAEITAVDVNPVKMEMAEKLGVIRTMTPSEITTETFGVVVEVAGVKATNELAMRIVKPGGVMIALGITGDQIDYPSIRIVRNEITIHGSIIYTLQDFTDAFALLQNPLFNLGTILSKIVPYTKFKEAFDDALSGNHAKIVLDFRAD
jgi:L-iditol 2-dehydrogenase